MRESNQTNARMIEKISVSTSSREIWGFGGFVGKTLLIFPQDYRFYYVCLEESRVC